VWGSFQPTPYLGGPVVSKTAFFGALGGSLRAKGTTTFLWGNFCQKFLGGFCCFGARPVPFFFYKGGLPPHHPTGLPNFRRTFLGWHPPPTQKSFGLGSPGTNHSFSGFVVLGGVGSMGGWFPVKIVFGCFFTTMGQPPPKPVSTS